MVAERKIYLADATDVTVVIVKDSRRAMARLASRFYDIPSRAFSLVGITGTNGKTTTTYLVDHIARTLGNRTGLIGTVGISIDGTRLPSSHTTPESPDLQRLFAQMRDENCGVVSMEVSSHALDLDRTWATSFAVTAFTNLTQDHLDYHKTFESYFAAKARLFSRDYPAKRVINIDSVWGKELLKRCSANEDPVITTGFDRSAQIHPIEVEYGTADTTLKLSVRGNVYVLNYPLVGRFNVENVMTAFGVGLSSAIAPSRSLRRSKTLRPFLGVSSASAPSMMGAFPSTSTTPTLPMPSRRRSRRSMPSMGKGTPSSCSAAEAIGMPESGRSWGPRPSPPITPWSLRTIRALKTPRPSSTTSSMA